MNVLFYETVEENWQRGKADIVQSQVGCVVQWLGRTQSGLFYFLFHITGL